MNGLPLWAKRRGDRARTTTIHGLGGSVSVRRTAEGVPKIYASSWQDACFALGWLHGTDRGGQIALLRLAGEGRLCETLWDDGGLLELDVYFRRLGLARDAGEHAGEIPQGSAALLSAYAAGVSRAWEERRPLPFRLLRYQPPPLTLADLLLLLKVASFVGLAESQRVGELFLVEAVRRGADERSLRELLPSLGPLDVDLLRSLSSVPSFFPNLAASAAAGSNAWAVSGARSSSGSPLLCCDPHLEVGWLPALGYEVELRAGTDWVKGLTLAGLPGFLVGRTASLAWGVTYSCADTCDFLIERCREGRYLRQGAWHPYRERRERILKKRGEPVEILCFETDQGILEGNPREDGTYLSWNWTGLGSGGVGSFVAFFNLLSCRTVAEAQEAVRTVDIPTLHFTFADRDGNIGYQFAGAVPRRSDGQGGLAPRAGWEAGGPWQGLLDPARDHPSEHNPACGYVASANEARRRGGGPVLTTLPMPPFRRRRIQEVLGSKGSFTVEEMQALQYDLISLEARELLPLYLPFVPPGPYRWLLEAWDHGYRADSLAACLFENIHRCVMEEVLGRVLGREWVHWLLTETNLILLLAGPFAGLLARSDSSWLPAAHREAVLSSGVKQGLAKPIEPWGKRQTVFFQNLFLGGRFAGFPGLGRGPFPLTGNHATVKAGVVLRARGRKVTVGPAYHFVADLAGTDAWTNLPGGPNESLFSRWYASDLRRWLEGVFKKI